MGRPETTRLRFVKSKDAETITKFCDSLGVRIMVYDLEYVKGKWYLWFVPGDQSPDIRSGDLD